MVKELKMAFFRGSRVRLTPLTMARSTAPERMSATAWWSATKEDEQAVSMARLMRCLLKVNEDVAGAIGCLDFKDLIKDSIKDSMNQETLFDVWRTFPQ
jgi:hypothetical protein